MSRPTFSYFTLLGTDEKVIVNPNTIAYIKENHETTFDSEDGKIFVSKGKSKGTRIGLIQSGEVIVNESLDKVHEALTKPLYIRFNLPHTQERELD
jgi:uncharacterized protein YlzI (FlbEa/FlbD family)